MDKESPAMAVVLTGGDGLRFARALESGIFAIPFLTLEGYHALAWNIIARCITGLFLLVPDCANGAR